MLNENDLKSIGEKVGKYLGSGISGALLDSSKAATKAFNGFYEKLKYQRDFDLISEQEYYARLEGLRDRYFTVGTDNWVKYTQKIYAYQEKMLKAEQKEIEKLYDGVLEYASEKLEAVMKKQQKLAENLNSFGGFYNVNTVYMNGYKDQYYSLHDMSWDIEAIERYMKDMDAVKNKADRLSVTDGAKKYLLDSIKEMDTEGALQFMGALLYANDDTFSNYAEKAFEKFNLSQSVSARQYEDEFNESVGKSYENMVEALKEAGYEIPDGFYVSGSISAQKFGEAFVLELDNQLGIIRDMIDEFNAGLEVAPNVKGDVYNTTNTSYNISANTPEDTVEQIRRYETVKRLAGVS